MQLSWVFKEFVDTLILFFSSSKMSCDSQSQRWLTFSNRMQKCKVHHQNLLLFTVLKLFWMEFFFKAYVPNQGCLPFVISALYCPGPATLISLHLTWSEGVNSTAEPCSDHRNLDFQYTRMTVTLNHICYTDFCNRATFQRQRATARRYQLSSPRAILNKLRVKSCDCHFIQSEYSWKCVTGGVSE